MKAGCLLADAFKEEIAMYLTAIFLIGLLASTIGAICGIGGGVIIKPAIDILGLTDVSSTSFLSSCTVLMMTPTPSLTAYTESRKKAGDEKRSAFGTWSCLRRAGRQGGV